MRERSQGNEVGCSANAGCKRQRAVSGLQPTNYNRVISTAGDFMNKHAAVGTSQRGLHKRSTWQRLCTESDVRGKRSAHGWGPRVPVRGGA